MKKVGIPAVWLAAMLCTWGSVALGQGKDAVVKADEMSTATEKNLLLRGGAPINKTNLPAEAMAVLVKAAEQVRFDVKDYAFDSKETLDWCTSGAAEAQQKVGDVDTKGQGVVTMEALKKRCSEIASYKLEADHSCMPNNGICTVTAKVSITMYKAVDSNGKVSIMVNKDFGKNGTQVVYGIGDSTISPPGKELMTAAMMARVFAERHIRDIPYFQMRAPVQNSTDSVSQFCMGKEELEMDQAFFIMVANAKGEKERVGWGKIRDFWDGCTMTDKMQLEADKGKKFTLKPAELQNILGRGDIKPGMTAFEMPAIGLNVNVKLGTTSVVGGIGTNWASPRLSIGAEYDLARHINLSEFYVALDLGVGYGLNQGSGVTALPIQAEAGVLKRWQGGRLMFDVGAFFAFSYNYWKDAPENFIGYGGAVKFNVGFQVTPRFIFQIGGGFRFLDANRDLCDSSLTDSNSCFEWGPMTTLALQYNI